MDAALMNKCLYSAARLSEFYSVLSLQ